MIMRKIRWPIVSWFALLVVAIPLLRFASRVAPPAPLPDEWDLPEAYEGWQGETIYYSTDPEVTRAFREADIVTPGVCPVSGAPLDTVSAAERRLLPADVDIARRLYHDSNGRQRVVIRVVTGESREGIHRPEWCLTAQGVRIGELEYVDARDAHGKPFKVAVYPMFPRNAPDSARAARFFVYWFEGPNAHTPHNLVRILKMGWERLRTGRAQRWAYFSIQIDVPPGRAAPEREIASAVEWLLMGRAAGRVD